MLLVTWQYMLKPAALDAFFRVSSTMVQGVVVLQFGCSVM